MADEKKKEKTAFDDAKSTIVEEFITGTTNWIFEWIPADSWHTLFEDHLAFWNGLFLLGSWGMQSFTNFPPFVDNAFRTGFATARAKMNERAKSGPTKKDTDKEGKMPFLAILFLAKPESCKEVFIRLKNLSPEKRESFLKLVVDEKYGKAMVATLAAIDPVDFEEAIDRLLVQWQPKKEKKMSTRIDVSSKLAKYPVLIARWGALNEEQRKALTANVNAVNSEELDTHLQNLNDMDPAVFGQYVEMVMWQKGQQVRNRAFSTLKEAAGKLKDREAGRDGFLASFQKGRDIWKKGGKI